MKGTIKMIHVFTTKDQFWIKTAVIKEAEKKFGDDDRLTGDEKERKYQYTKQVTQKEKAKHDRAVKSYKQAWKSRNALWKLFHLKYNPRKKDFDNMSQMMISKQANVISKKR